MGGVLVEAKNMVAELEQLEKSGWSPPNSEGVDYVEV